MGKDWHDLTVILTLSAIIAVLGTAVAFCLQPTPQIVLPCHVVGVHDGDTLTAELRIRCQVRLVDCWAPELRDPGGPEAKTRMVALADGKPGLLEVPLNGSRSLGDVLTFGRILGRVWIDGRDVGAVLVGDGLATKAKVTR